MSRGEDLWLESVALLKLHMVAEPSLRLDFDGEGYSQRVSCYVDPSLTSGVKRVRAYWHYRGNDRVVQCTPWDSSVRPRVDGATQHILEFARSKFRARVDRAFVTISPQRLLRLPNA